MIDLPGLIKKTSHTFVAMFFWLLVRHRLSPKLADKVVPWDRAVLLTSLVEGLDIKFVWVLISVIHERAFKTFNTYSFACVIF